MRNTNANREAGVFKQGAILFLCALLCAASIFGIWKILHRNSPTSGTLTPSEAVETPSAAQQTDAPTQPPEPIATPSPVPTPELTRQPEETVVMANPLEERGALPNTMSEPETEDIEETPESMPGESVQLPLSGLIIGIDPGHQAHGNSEQEPVSPGSSETKAKVSSGTQGVASGVPEYETNLKISLQLRDVLQALGAQVVMTRTRNDVDISNIERAQMCNEAGVDVVLRLHCNGSTNSDAQGIGLYVTATGDIAAESYAIAEVLLEAMVQETGAEKDGVFRRDTYSGLNWSEVPAIIVEMGFMSNAEEDLKLQDPEYQQKLIDGMVRGLAEYYGRTLMEE